MPWPSQATCSARAKGRDPVGGATLVLHVFASPGQLWPTPMILVELFIVTLVTISVSCLENEICAHLGEQEGCKRL